MQIITKTTIFKYVYSYFKFHDFIIKPLIFNILITQLKKIIYWSDSPSIYYLFIKPIYNCMCI